MQGGGERGGEVPLRNMKSLRMNEYDETGTESLELEAGARKENGGYSRQTMMNPLQQFLCTEKSRLYPGTWHRFTRPGAAGIRNTRTENNRQK